MLLASLLFSIPLLLLSLPNLNDSGIFEYVTAEQQQHNTVVVNVAFPSLISTSASIINNNNSMSSTIIPTQPSSFSSYNNSTYGIKFQSPNGWNKIEVLSGRTTLIEFRSPSTNATESIQLPGRVAISIEKDLGNVTTLQEYSQATDNLLNRMLGNFTAKSQPITLSGQPTISRIIATKHPISGIGISIAQVLTIKNNNAYSITYTVPTSSYYRYLPVVQQILNSFQIADTLQTSTPPPTTPPISNTHATSPPTVTSESECVPGFHLDSSQKQCVDNTPTGP